MKQAACHFAPTSGVTPLPYLLTLPHAYRPESTEQWPLLLFLHGRGEQGNDLELLKLDGLPKRLQALDDFPFITISPQCPTGSDWSAHLETLLALLDESMVRYHVDPSQIYLTGLSMGGRGAWQLAMCAPQRFAALAPICGRIPDMPDFLDQIGRLNALPIWAFHGAKDPVVPIENSEKIVAALEQSGGNVRFTVYPEADHDAWTATYANPDLYRWFATCRRITDRPG